MQDAAQRPSPGRSAAAAPPGAGPPQPHSPRDGSAGRAGPSRGRGYRARGRGHSAPPAPWRPRGEAARTPTWRLRHGIGGKGRAVGGARPRCAPWLVAGAVNPRASPRAVLSLRGALGLGRLRPLTPAEGRAGGASLRGSGSVAPRWPSGQVYVPMRCAVAKPRLLQPAFQPLGCAEQPSAWFQGLVTAPLCTHTCPGVPVFYSFSLCPLLSLCSWLQHLPCAGSGALQMLS